MNVILNKTSVAGLCLWLTLGLSCALAGEVPQTPQVRLAADAVRSSLAVFSGGDCAIQLELTSPAEAVLAVRGTLYQVASTLAVPLEKNVVVAAGISVPAGASKTLSFSLPVPAVKMPVAMVFKLETRPVASSGSTDAADWRPAGAVFLRVLPPKAEVAAALHQRFVWLVKQGVTPVIFGNSPAVRSLFKVIGIEVATVPDLTAVEPNTHYLYLGEDGSGELPQALRQGVAMIRWTTDPFSPGGMDIARSPRSFVVTINHAAPVRADDAGLWADVAVCLSSLQHQLQP